MTVDPATVRAAMTPVVQAAVLDAFKLGVGHAIRAIDAALQPGNSLAIPVEGTYQVMQRELSELRAYVATMTYEDLP
jgi:hypothetical protein